MKQIVLALGIGWMIIGLLIVLAIDLDRLKLAQAEVERLKRDGPHSHGNTGGPVISWSGTTWIRQEDARWFVPREPVAKPQPKHGKLPKTSIDAQGNIKTPGLRLSAPRSAGLEGAILVSDGDVATWRCPAGTFLSGDKCVPGMTFTNPATDTRTITLPPGANAPLLANLCNSVMTYEQCKAAVDAALGYPVVELPLEPGTGPMMLQNSHGEWHPWRKVEVPRKVN